MNKRLVLSHSIISPKVTIYKDIDFGTYWRKVRNKTTYYKCNMIGMLDHTSNKSTAIELVDLSTNDTVYIQIF